MTLKSLFSVPVTRPSSHGTYLNMGLDYKLTLKDIKERLLISDVVRGFIELKPSSDLTYMCRCPFHNDNNPSMVVRDDWGSYYCFACTAKGDMVDFIRNYKKVTFFEAVDTLHMLTKNHSSPLVQSSPLPLHSRKGQKLLFATNRYQQRSIPSKTIVVELGIDSHEKIEKLRKILERSQRFFFDRLISVMK